MVKGLKNRPIAAGNPASGVELAAAVCDEPDALWEVVDREVITAFVNWRPA